MFWNQDPVFIGSGLGAAVLQTPPRKTAPNKEQIIAGPMRITANIPFALPESADEMIRRYGRKYYQAMLTDPSVKSSYLALKLGILSGGVHVLPCQRPPYYRRKAGERQLDPSRVRDMTPEEKLAKAAAEFCQRCLDRLGDVTAILIQWLDCAAYGVKLAEITYRLMEEGADKGMLVFDTIHVKPDWAWRFVVNSMLKPLGILTWSPETTGFRVLAPEKYHWLTWLPVDGDPRGTSQLRAAAEWWNLKTQIKPFYYQHLSRWGSPGIDFEMAEGDTRLYPPTDANGNIIPGAEGIPAEQHHLAQVQSYQNGSALVHPHGSKVNVVEPTGAGEAFLNAFHFFDEQIVMAIKGAVRAAVGHKSSGTKGEAGMDQDSEDLVSHYGRGLVRGGVRGWCYELLKINKGAEYADLYTPEVIVGAVPKHDLPALWNAGANLAKSGYIGESQKAGLDAILDLPERDPEADAEAAMAAQKQTEKDAAKPGQGSDKTSDNGEKGAEK
jgi:hypothetical protein